MFKKLLRTTLISCLLSTSLFGANIIFDLGGVLIDTKKTAAFSKLGISNVFAYLLKGNKPGNIKKKLYEVLDKIQGTQSSAKDPDGDALPNLMCNWMANTKSAQHILDTIIEQINNNPEWFASTAEKKVVQALARMMFTPQSFIQTRQLIKNGVKFVKECKKQGHKCYILSNWDTDSFAVMQKKYKDFFDLFDGIVISGNACCLKPDYGIYQKLLINHNLAAHECVFIDDQEENIIAAQQMGMHAIHCKNSGNPNFKQIQKQISQWEQKSEEEKQNSWLPNFNKQNMIKFLILTLVFSTLIKTVV